MRAFDADRKTYAPERLLAFSDAVMAVAITLLVLDLKLPEGVSDADLGAVLRGSLHGVGVYALSFVVIGLFWMGHHQQFSNIRRVDGPLMWLNLLFLMTIGLIPFVTSILSDHGDELPTMLYAGVLVAACLVSAALWAYARHDPALMPADVPRSVRREGLVTPLLTALVFALSIPIAFFWSPAAGQWTWLLALPASRAAAWLDN